MKVKETMKKIRDSVIIFLKDFFSLQIPENTSPEIPKEVWIKIRDTVILLLIFLMFYLIFKVNHIPLDNLLIVAIAISFGYHLYQSLNKK